MANDLYGELLARALQRRAPPGHFPAFVTPGEANLLRSQGGGVAPGGGQYMAGGIPAFFEYGGDYGGLGTPGYGGGAMGFEDFGFMHTPVEEDEAAWEGVVAAGLSGLEGFTAEDEGDMGRSRSDQMAAFLAARAKAEQEAAAKAEQEAAAALAAAVKSDTSAISSQVNPSFAAGVEDFTPGGWETPGFEGEQGIGTPTDPGDTDSDAGVAAQQAAMEMAQHEVNTGRMSQAQAFSALDAPIDRGGLGRFSPAVGWGINSETGLASFADLAALNAQDHQGYAINNPQPTAASIAASHVFSQLNPTVANAVIGLSSLVAPGPAGFAATIAALMEEKGLLNIPAMRSIPGIQAISDILDIPQDFVAEIMRGITDPIGDVLSQGTDALADALSGFLGPEESAGPDDAGEVEGGAPDIEIEIVPPIATDTDAPPAPPARTFADVDDETRRRILANIISGLQRTDRPTEGATAFGPLFT